MIRVLIHAGFHKTGTTSVQKTLAANRAALEPQLIVGLRADLVEVAETARAYSDGLEPVELPILQGMFAAYIAGLALTDGQVLLISSEDLSGHMPGRRGLTSYAAAPALMQALAAGAEQALGEALDLTFVFSTRQREAWVRSLFWQNVMRDRLLDDLDRFRASVSGAEELDAVVDRVAAAVGPHRVRRFSLEQAAPRRFGPLAPLLDLAGIGEETRAALVELPPKNARPDHDLSEVFLALNRSTLQGGALNAAKQALVRLAKAVPATEAGDGNAPRAVRKRRRP